MGQSYSHRVLSKLHLLSSVCVGVTKGVDSRLPRISAGNWLHFGAVSSCGSKMLNTICMYPHLDVRRLLPHALLWLVQARNIIIHQQATGHHDLECSYPLPDHKPQLCAPILGTCSWLIAWLLTEFPENFFFKPQKYPQKKA